MDAIEKQIHEHFANLPEEASMPEEQQTATPQEPLRDYEAPPTLMAPFARVNTVVDGSPASLAGLKPGDQIRNFGYVNVSNHDDLKKVAECVQGNEGVRHTSTCFFFVYMRCCSNMPGARERYWSRYPGLMVRGRRSFSCH